MKHSFHSNDQKISDVKVETRCIDTFERSLIADLVIDIKDNKSNDEIKTNIKKNIKHLYYSSIKSKEHHFLRNVLLGEVITLNSDLVETSDVFKYESLDISDKVTTIVLKQKDTKPSIILDIIESNGGLTTRSQTKDKDKIVPADTEYKGPKTRSQTKDKNKIVPLYTKLGIKNMRVVTIKVKPNAQYFTKELEKSSPNVKSEQGKNDPSGDYYLSEPIQIGTSKQTDGFTNGRYNSNLETISPVNITELIESISESDGPPSAKKSKSSNFQTLLSNALQPVASFIKKEADGQSIIQGMLMDQTLVDGQRIKVFSEIIFGVGRADIAFLTINNDFKETKCVFIECKYTKRGNLKFNDAREQLRKYIEHSKGFTDLPEAVGLVIVLNKIVIG